MEPSRNRDSQLPPPESIRLRDSPSINSRGSYGPAPTGEDDNGRGSDTPPVLPEISDLGRTPRRGLGISDPEGQSLGPQPGRNSAPVSPAFPSRSSHSRSVSDDPFGDHQYPTSQFEDSHVPHSQQVLHSERDSTVMGSPSITLDPGEDPKGPSGSDKRSRDRTVAQSRASWLTLSILFLAFYSTAFSGVFLVVAFVKPRFGKSIGNDGGMSPNTASILSAFFAKTIELSFVTVFVAFLGQVLTRRSLTTKLPGITIADMSMRSWIMQPGTLITHWENVKYAGLTFLGVTSLTATFMGMLYTTAAETLVSPQLGYGPETPMNLWGQVYTKFANPEYQREQCETPLPHEMDPEHGASTCLSIYHVSQAYHNYQRYIEEWANRKTQGDLTPRQLPVGTWYDNTTVTGRWIEVHNTTELSANHKRMVDNVTVAMPHAGVYASSRDPANDLRQPKDFGGQGEFTITAQVPSPAINVICAGMTEEELDPIIYKKWPHAYPDHVVNGSNWNGNIDNIPRVPNWINKTVVDDIFNFGPDGGQQAPVFLKVPKKYNTLINGTGVFPANSVYILASSPPSFDPPHVLCSLKGGWTSQCSTEYHAASSGGQLSARCDFDNEPMAYGHKEPDMPLVEYDPDWKNVGDEWGKAVNLGDGSMDGNGTNPRLLTHFVPSFNNKTNTASLRPGLPSIAEALAAMASSTLLISTEDAPFNHTWEHIGTGVTPGGKSEYQEYPVKLRVSDYAPGAKQPWQNMFFVVLILVFLTNLFCLIYMYLGIRCVQLTDFTDPQNAFVLALNSPFSSRVSGASGRGPSGRQLKEKWIILMNEPDDHYFVTSKVDPAPVKRATTVNTQRKPSRLGKGSLSPAVEEYRRLSGTTSSLSLLR